MMLTMCACAQTNAAKDKVNDSILDIDTQESEFLQNFKDTDDGTRYFVNANGVVLKKDDYLRLCTDTAYLAPDTIGTLDAKVIKEYIQAKENEVGSSSKPEDDETYFTSYTDVKYTVNEYKTAASALKPAEVNFLTYDMAALIKQGGTAVQKDGLTVIDFGNRVVTAVSLSCTEKEANGKLKAELSFEGELIDVIAYRNSDFGKDITTFTLKDSGLKAEGNKIALNLGDAQGSCGVAYTEYGIICMSEKG